MARSNESGGKKSTLTPEQVSAEAAAVSARAKLASAGNKAKNDPTPANVAAVKNAYKDVVANPTQAGKAVADLPGLIESSINARIDTSTAIAEAEAAIAEAGAAVTAAGAYNPPDKKPPVIADAAYDAMVAGIGIYKIQGIADTLAQIRSDYPSATTDEILILLRNDARYNKAYKERFSGNDGLIAAGKMPLDEKTYFNNEQAYERMFKAYDLGQFANTKQYATLIGNDIAPTEATTRVSSVYNRVLSNVSTLGVFQRYYKMLSVSDIVAGILDPKEQLPALERKITSAEIGGAAVRQGLDAYQAATDTYESRKMYSNVVTGTVGSDVLAASGETGAEAIVDYKTIAERLPVMEKLSAISGSGLDQYGQQQAEEDVILGLASAKRKKDALLAAEAGRWSGAAGASQGAFSSKMY